MEKLTPNYKMEEPVETPFMRAKQVWDDRLGTTAMQAKNWRIAAILSLFIAIASIGLCFYISSQAAVVPYVIEVDSLGEVRGIGPANRHYQPSQAVIKRQLESFVKLVRSVSTDLVVVQDNWIEAYTYVSRKGANILNSYVEETNPLDLVGQLAVTVKVTNVVSIKKDVSYRVTWIEEVFSKAGNKRGQKTYDGVFLVSHIPPRDEAMLRQNPIGLYIDEFNWSEVITAQK